jgi:hypothetical protein
VVILPAVPAVILTFLIGGGCAGFILTPMAVMLLVSLFPLFG